MLEARLKAGFRWPTIRACNGATFVKDGWRQVPLGREAEAKANEYLEVRMVGELPAEAAAAPKADEIPIDEEAAELAVAYGIDLGVREGPGAVVPTRTKGITLARVKDAIKSKCADLGCTEEAMAASVVHGVDLAAVEPGEDGIVTISEVLLAAGIDPDA